MNDCTQCWNPLNYCTCTYRIVQVNKTDNPVTRKEMEKLVKKAADKCFRDEIFERGYNTAKKREALIKTNYGKQWYQEIYNAINFSHNILMSLDGVDDDKLAKMPQELATIAILNGDLKPSLGYVLARKASYKWEDYNNILKKIRE